MFMSQDIGHEKNTGQEAEVEGDSIHFHLLAEINM